MNSYAMGADAECPPSWTKNKIKSSPGRDRMLENKLCVAVHFVWATWDRQPLITPDIEQELRRYIGAVCWDDNCDLLAVGGMPDHVHLLVQSASHRLIKSCSVSPNKNSIMPRVRSGPTPRRLAFHNIRFVTSLSTKVDSSVRAHTK